MQILLFSDDPGPDQGRERTLTLPGHDVTVGRSRKSWLRLKGERVSGSHLVFRTRQDRHLVADLGSSNGTKLNGRTLAPNEEVEVAHGDEILLPGYRIVVQDTPADWAEPNVSAILDATVLWKSYVDDLEVAGDDRRAELFLLGPGDQSIQSIPLKRGLRLTMGSGEVDLRIPDPRLAERHAAVSWVCAQECDSRQCRHAGHWEVADLAGRGDVAHNGDVVTGTAALSNLSRIDLLVGSDDPYVLELYESEQEPAGQSDTD